MPLQTSNTLAEGKINQRFELTGVTEHSAAFLQFLEKHGLKPGITLRITEIQEFDQSLLVALKNKTSVYLSHSVARQILVKPYEK
jgi:DtxR family Mn-dependent transcriptional regulator